MIEVKGLYKSFEDKAVLKDINATFENGKTNLIIGQSGTDEMHRRAADSRKRRIAIRPSQLPGDG